MVGLFVQPAPYIPGVTHLEGGQKLAEDLRESLIREPTRRAKAQFDACVKAAGITTAEWRTADGDRADEVALHARYADLVIINQTDPDEANASHFAGAVLMSLGRPALLLPYVGEFSSVGTHVLVAWNASREAARAVTDAARAAYRQDARCGGGAAEELAATVVPTEQLVSGVVALHAQYLVPGHVLLMQSEGLLIGRPNGQVDAVVERFREVLAKAVPTEITSNIVGARWSKLIVNLNNVLPALCNLSFKRVYANRFLRRLAVGLMREGIAVAARAGVHMEPLPGTPLPLFKVVAYLPALLGGALAARSAARLETHWPLRGSTWQSVARARPTEIEYLNGEIVRLGRELGVPTPLNEVVVALEQRRATERRFLTVHEIEQALTRNKFVQDDSRQGLRSTR